MDGLGGRSLLLYSLYTLILFVIFLFANFPHGLLLQRLLHSVDLPGMRLDIGDARFAWWRGFELQRVQLGPADPAEPAYLEADSVYVRPGLDGLFSGHPRSVKVSGPLYGGDVDLQIATGDMNRATLTVDDLQLQRYALLTALLEGGQLAGALSGAMTIETHGASTDDLRSAGEFELSKASLTDAKRGGIPVPTLHFDAMTLKYSVQGSRFEIQEFEADGPEMKVSISGQIALRQPVSDSVLNLKLTAVPGPDASDQIKTVLSMLPPPAKGAKPDTPHVVSGTLSKPRLR
ncbi:MAG: type II secretion system protein GspN [bacterium]